jgi:flavodoxin
MNTNMTEKKKLVVFFSRTDENYGVGYIAKGNTHIVAEMLASETGADLFQIEPVQSYPAEYDRCIEIAQQEKRAGARPEIKNDIRIEDYDMIFLGYPNWWSELPMAVYTFIEKHDWNGKLIAPFCTHEGSGLSATERRIQSACQGAKVLRGIAIQGSTAQHDASATRKAIHDWLKALEQ